MNMERKSAFASALASLVVLEREAAGFPEIGAFQSGGI